LEIELALDDFGKGYSSLGRLLQLPFNRIKIDRSFVADINLYQPGQKNIEKVIGAIASLGTALGMTTIVEGIETVEQMNIVRRTGCTEMQGYLSSRPVPAGEIGQ
jgi:EAL domain-containing protein (putative c-di-GMP-specific phosphodiesterase class I)